MKTDLERIYGYAQTQPTKPAVIHDDDIIEYGALWHKICGFSRLLSESGLQKGEAVIVKSSRSSAHVAAYYAVQLAGGVPVILSELMSCDAVQEVSRQYAVKWIVMDGGEHEPGVKIFSHDDVMRLADEWFREIDPVFPSLDDISEVLFSSGTTGKAKGVMITHRNMTSVAESCIKDMGLLEDHVSMMSNPLESVGPMRELHFTIQRGSTLVVAGSMINTANYFGYIEKYNVTGLYMTPFAMASLFEIAPGKLAQYKDQIRIVSSAASPLPEVTRERMIETLPHSRMFHFYSTTEFGLVSIMEYSSVREKKDCSGYLRDTMRVRVVDDDMRDVPDGQTGIIIVQGDSVCPGYWNNPELTDASFVDGWMLSGDVGFLDKDEYLYIVGRRDDIIIVSGYKVAPSMIEDVAMLCGLLKECVCVAHYDPKSKMEGLKMLIVPKDGMEETARKTLVRAMVKKLPEVSAENSSLIKAAVARILAIEIISEVPRGKNGKIDRKSLRSNA